ncbi:MAG: HPr family phosphocarrier protein [Candidatus Rokubacteria bacterium]|nr:HPr family phosphocarrier protein [Candidatus Rokubacteria bacterium]
MHLRVSALVVTLARTFQSEIHFAAGRQRVNAKSILGVLALGARKGKRLALVACGPDAARAARVLADLFESEDALCRDRDPMER